MTDANAYPACVHGKKVYEYCAQCEADARAGKHGGFERAQPPLASKKRVERPLKPLSLLPATASERETISHYGMMIDYWAAEARWQEQRADEAENRLDSWYTTEASIRGALMELVGDDVYLKAIDKAQVNRAAHNPKLSVETRALTPADFDYHTDACEAVAAQRDGMQNWPSACNCNGRRAEKTTPRRPHVDERVPGCGCEGCEAI